MQKKIFSKLLFLHHLYASPSPITIYVTSLYIPQIHSYYIFSYHSIGTAAYSHLFLQNYRRVAEVWMDEYKKYLYMRQPGWLQV